jgi:hypothetical protein
MPGSESAGALKNGEATWADARETLEMILLRAPSAGESGGNLLRHVRKQDFGLAGCFVPAHMDRGNNLLFLVHMS